MDLDISGALKESSVFNDILSWTPGRGQNGIEAIATCKNLPP